MSTESLQQMKDRWTLLMAARTADPNGSRRGAKQVLVRDVDPKYARDVAALGVQIAEREAAERSQPRISQQQLAQLQALDEMRGITVGGKQLLFDMSERGTTFRRNLDNLRKDVEAGKDIGPAIKAQNALLADSKNAMGVTDPSPSRSTRVTMPSNQAVGAYGNTDIVQPTITQRTE